MAGSDPQRKGIQLNDVVDMVLKDPERYLGTTDPRVIIDKVSEAMPLLETDDVQELQRKIAEHQAELYKISADRAIQELVVKNAQCGPVASSQIFSVPLPHNGGDKENALPSSDASDSSHSEYTAVLQELSSLSLECLRKKEAVEKLEKKLEAIRKQNFELKKRNRGLMSIIQQHEKELEKVADEVQRSDACKGLKEELEKRLARVEIIKNTLQALIMGSGVNWAQDPDLMEAVLSCGDSQD